MEMRVAIEEDVALEIERLFFGHAVTCVRTVYCFFGDRRRGSGVALNSGYCRVAVLS